MHFIPTPHSPWRLWIAGLALGVSALAWAETPRAPIAQWLQQGQHAQALEAADQALRDAPERADLLFYRGVALTELQRDDEALAVFRDLNQRYPGSPEPLNNIGVLLARQGQLQAAADALKSALQADADYAAAHENLGDVYARMAAQAYQRALQAPQGQNGHAEPKWRLVSQIAPLAPPSALAPPKSPAVRASAAPQAATGEPPATAAAEATPARAEAAPLTPEQTQVHAALRRWAQAWSQRDVGAYVAAYVPDYAPAGMTHEQWRTQRQSRIGDKTSIRVSVKDVSVQVFGDKATARFVQHYAANDHRSVDRKVAVFVRQGSDWRIEQERTR